jgi:hypothetical protein
MPSTYLPPDHHALRYVPWARLRKDEEDNVIGVLGSAFKLRDDEDYLSATWIEFFSAPDHAARIRLAVAAVRNSEIDVRPKSGFAIGCVKAISDTCLADPKKVKIRVIHEEAADNAAHAALRGWPRDNDQLLDLIAEDPWRAYVLAKDIP